MGFIASDAMTQMIGISGASLLCSMSVINSDALIIYLGGEAIKPVHQKE